MICAVKSSSLVMGRSVQAAIIDDVDGVSVELIPCEALFAVQILTRCVCDVVKS